MFQKSVSEKCFKNIDNAFESNKKEEVKTKKNKGNRSKSSLVYNNYFTFYKYRNTNEFIKRSLDSKLNDLKEFKGKLEISYHDTIQIKPNNEDRKKDLEKRKVVLDAALELCNKLVNIYKTQNDELKKSRKKRIKFKNVSENLPIDLYLDEDLDDLPQLEGDEKAKLDPEQTIGERVKINRRKRKNEGTGLKILTPNKILTRLPLFQYY